MASQDKSMCAVAGYDDDDDYSGDWINNFLSDLPMETLDGDGPIDCFKIDGPIPTDVFPEVFGIGGGGSADFVTGCGGSVSSGVGTCKAEFKPIVHKEVIKPQQKQPPTTFSQEKKPYRIPKSFEAPSPDSVLERRTSSSAGKNVSFGTEIAIPVRTRTKRSRPQLGSALTPSSWSKSLQQFPIQMVRKKRRKLAQHDDATNEVKKCSHCEITKTPQWREGPMGPKTLCNACGVRYRSGRLFPEYRPAASPTFVPSLHSNSHRKVVEMRQKGAAMNNYVVKKPFDELKCSHSTL